MVIRSLGVVAASVAVLAGSLATVPIASAAPARGPAQVAAPVPALAWASCGPQLEAFQCATARVPVDYDDPSGPTTTVALTRLPASGPAQQRLGSLFTNPGGPGGSGVDFVQQGAQTLYSPEVRRRYDVVGFDPRGVSRSDPATCFDTPAAEQAFLAGVEPYPVTTPDEVRYTSRQAQLSARCQASSPGRLSVASTANVARDLDLLRQAVGDPVLHYAGYSYGTYLGATYARLFPGRVGRFVLDATVDPVAYSGTGTGDAAASVPLGIRTRQGLGADETFGEFTRLCRQAGPPTCSLAALGDPETVIRATLERLALSPVVVAQPDGTTLTVTQQWAVALTFLLLYSPAAWTDVADFYLRLASDPGSPAGAAEAAAGASVAVEARLHGQEYPSVGGALASLCVDTASTRQVLRYPDHADRADAEHPYFGRYRAWASLPCEFWKVRDEDRFAGPWRQTTTAPVLVVGTRFDPGTPYRNTQPYADLFPDARVLTLQGWGHSSLGKSGCVDQAVATYLVTGQRPRAAATCPPDTVPFSAPVSGLRPDRPQVPPGLPLSR